jgi:hypothetical protein
MLSVLMNNVVMMRVIMRNVVAPKKLEPNWELLNVGQSGTWIRTVALKVNINQFNIYFINITLKAFTLKPFTIVINSVSQ